MQRRILLFSLVLASTLFGLRHAALAALPAGGILIKAGGPAVYWYSHNGSRYVFPNEKVYKSWYPDFSGILLVSDSDLASIKIGGNVTYRPGTRLVKITTDPKTYAVDAHGNLRWVKSESVAAQLYGSDWNRRIDDIPDAFFVNYTVGTPISASTDFSPAAATAAATDIDTDKSATPPVPPVPSPTASAPAAPVAVLPAPTGTNDDGLVIAGAQNLILGKFTLTAALEALQLTKVRVSLLNPGSAADVLRMRLYDGDAPVSGDAVVDSSGNADFSGVSFVIPRNESRVLTVAADLNTIAGGGASGDDVSIKLHVPASDDGSYELHGVNSGTVLKSGSGGDKSAFQKLFRKTVPVIANVALPTAALTNGDVIASRFGVTANPAEQVSLKKLTFNVSKTATLGVGSAGLREIGSGSNLASAVSLAPECAGGAGTACVVTVTLSSEQAIAAGTTKIYELHLTVTGAAGSSSILTNLLGDTLDMVGQLSGSGTQIAGLSRNFIWSDNAGVPHNDADNGSADWIDGKDVRILPNDVQGLIKS